MFSQQKGENYLNSRATTPTASQPGPTTKAPSTGEIVETEQQKKRREIIVVTSNPGKFLEISKELTKLRIRAVQKETPYPEIQADELRDVVDYGLDVLIPIIDKPFIIDDSGLFIDTLDGFPGVYSHYIYKTLGTHKVLELLCGHEDRKAHFETVIGYVDENRQKHFFGGACIGRIGKVPKGNFGFGYDPIFIPNGHERGFGQMSHVEKNAISHRGNAIRSFIDHLREEMKNADGKKKNGWEGD